MTMYKKILFPVLSMTLVFAGFIPGGAAEAACAPGSNTMDLDGYIEVEKPVGGVDRIYVSTQSWNENNPSQTISQNFQISFDTTATAADPWSGRGWMDNIGWINFGPGQIARIESIENDPLLWGNVNSRIDLGAVQHDGSAGFTGDGIHTGLTGGGTNVIVDDHVGLGRLDFRNVHLIESDCTPVIDINITGTSATCPSGSGTISWRGQHVTDCRVGDGWNNDFTPGTSLGTDTYNSATVELDSTGTQNVTIVCTSTVDGSVVTGQASFSCTDETTTGPGGGGGTTPAGECNSTTENCNKVTPIYIES